MRLITHDTHAAFDLVDLNNIFEIGIIAVASVLSVQVLYTGIVTYD